MLTELERSELMRKLHPKKRGCWDSQNSRTKEKKEKKNENPRQVRKSAKEKQDSFVKDILDDIFDEGKNLVEQPEKNSVCEICGTDTAAHICMIFGEPVILCANCFTNNSFVGTPIFSDKGIKIVELVRGEWKVDFTSLAAYFDHDEVIKKDFCVCHSDEEADFILKKFGDKKQLGVVNNHGKLLEVTNGPEIQKFQQGN